MKRFLWAAGSILWLALVCYIGTIFSSQPVQVADSIKNSSNVRIYHDIKYDELPDSRMDIIMPLKVKKGDKLPLILWTHGGGFIGGDKRYKNPYLSQLAEKGFIVANMNYALAPQYKYPIPIMQQAAAAHFLKNNQLHLPIDMNQIIIGGDSAGAQLASQFAAVQTNRSLRKAMNIEQSFTRQQLKAVILFGGLYDMKTVRATHFPRIKLFMESYTGETQWEKDFVPINQLSTTRNVTKDYPPVFLTVGDADPFVTQADELIAVLKHQHVPYTTSLFSKQHRLRHQYQFHMQLKESQLTYKRLLMFLGTYTSQNPYQSNTASDSIIMIDE